MNVESSPRPSLGVTGAMVSIPPPGAASALDDTSHAGAFDLAVGVS